MKTITLTRFNKNLSKEKATIRVVDISCVVDIWYNFVLDTDEIVTKNVTRVSLFNKEPIFVEETGAQVVTLMVI